MKSELIFGRRIAVSDVVMIANKKDGCVEDGLGNRGLEVLNECALRIHLKQEQMEGNGMSNGIAELQGLHQNDTGYWLQ